MQMRSPESLNLWKKSEYTLQIWALSCENALILFTVLIYLAEIKEPCDATTTQMVERCTFCVVIL